MQRIAGWAWYLYLFLWFWSVPLLAFGLVPPGTEWMGTVILVLSGGLCGWWLIERFGGRGALAALIIALGSWGAEHLGVSTGWPFGAYAYTGVLAPELGGVVPLAIPFAWLLVVPGALEVARLLIGPRFGPQVLAAATLAMLLDMTIEPVAVYVNNYWIWEGSGPIAGIPTSNFIAWWVLALLLALPARALTGAPSAAEGPSIPAWLFLLTLALFAVVNLAHGYIGTGALGLALLAGIGAVTLRAKRTWPLRFEQIR